MHYALFVDWENIWHEHVGRCFPAYCDAGSMSRRQKLGKLVLPKYPELQTLDSHCLSALQQLPQAILDACKHFMGTYPSKSVATAIWEMLPLARELQIGEVLRSKGFMTTSPRVSGFKTSRADRKNASDIRLVLDFFSQSFLLRQAERKRQTRAQLATSLKYDAYVFLSGDFIFGQVLDYVEDVLGAQAWLLTHSHNVAGALFTKLRDSHRRNRMIFLDRLPAYAQSRDHCLSQDPLHQHKISAAPVGELELIAAVLIKRLNDRTTFGDRVAKASAHEVRHWIGQWVRFWKESCGREIALTPEQALITLELKGVVRVTARNQNHEVHLNPPSSQKLIADCIALEYARRYAFEHLFDIPPVHYAPL